jgi:acetyl esterase/lipase
VLKYRVVEKKQDGIPAMDMDTGKMPPIPATLPPMFLAWAQDDDVALAPIVRFHDALRAAGHKPEVHVFARGGHGFGMKKQGTSSDHWIDEPYDWLEAQGLTKGGPIPDR